MMCKALACCSLAPLQERQKQSSWMKQCKQQQQQQQQ
jgi:hypothetical protein